MAITKNNAKNSTNNDNSIISLLKKIDSLSKKDRELLISILNRNNNEYHDNIHQCEYHCDLH